MKKAALLFIALSIIGNGSFAQQPAPLHSPEVVATIVDLKRVRVGTREQERARRPSHRSSKPPLVVLGQSCFPDRHLRRSREAMIAHRSETRASDRVKKSLASRPR